MKKILLVEDSKEIFPMVNQALATISELTWAKSINEAKECLESTKFELILLDINLPDGSGIDLCYKIQSSDPSTPIFFLTANKDLSQKVLGFSAGADDYITKPFEPLELKVRVESKLKKIDQLNESLLNLKWKEIEIAQSKQEVSINSNDNTYEKIELTALEYKILTYLAEKPQHVFPRDQMLNDIWGENVYVYSRSVDTHVSKLRKKLKHVSHIIESVHGVGYKFIPTEL